MGRDAAIKEGHKNISWVQSDARKIPFADASFDLVVSRLALHHWPQPQTIVNEMARLCRGKLAEHNSIFILLTFLRSWWESGDCGYHFAGRSYRRRETKSESLRNATRSRARWLCLRPSASSIFQGCHTSPSPCLPEEESRDALPYHSGDHGRKRQLQLTPKLVRPDQHQPRKPTNHH